MADFWSNLGDGVAAIAPTIASAFGGPLAGLAVTTLEKALGVQPGQGSEEALKNALASPEQMLALRQADLAFKQFCLDNGLKLEQVAAADRDSARQREAAVKDKVPAILALLITLGFFGMLGSMFIYDVPPQNKDMVNIMLGSLGAAWVAVVSYYFGSTAASRSKDTTIASLAKG